MADLNALIAQGAQFQAMPDPFVQYGRMQQLEQGQQANQLNRMKMEEAQAATVERNALRGLDPTSPNYESQLFKVNPQLGIAYRKERTAAEAQQATQERQNVDAAAARQGMLGQAYRDISSRPSDANITAHMEDVQASPLFKPDEVARVKQLGQTLLSMPFEQRGAFLASQGAKSSDLIVKPVPAPTSVDATTMQALGYPLTPKGFADFNEAKRQDRLLTPEQEAQKTRIALASRPPAAPRPEPAPSITNIVDPTNPNQMIAIDTRRYQGGGVGSPGVIGASGKEPGAAVRTNKAEAGKTQLSDDLENLRNSFDALDKLRAIPSTGRGALSNVGSALASSRVGQLTGQAFATEAQVERDVINSARSRLVNSIKNATGMSAQQLNSNVELQTMLKSISDPGQSYQSAIRIIDDIENAYVKGNGMPPKPGKPVVPAATGVDASNPLLK